MIRRKAALFTSMPEETQAEAMKRAAIMAKLTGYVVGGETARRHGWVVPIVLRILDRGYVNGSIVNRGGRFEDYASLPDAVFADGVVPVIRQEDLGYFEEARKAMDIFKELDDIPEGTTLRMGLPHVFDLLLAGFQSKAESEEYRTAFLEAYASELLGVGIEWGDRISYWLETPLCLKAVRDAYHQGKDFERVAQGLAEFTAEVVSYVPEEISVDLHLCNGDFGGRGWEDSIDLVPTVTLANAMKEALGSNVGVIHIPTASGNVKPATDLRFYEPLRRLRADMVISAGFVHPGVDLDTHKKVLHIIEDSACRSVRPASYCGHGRGDVASSVTSCELITQLCDA